MIIYIARHAEAEEQSEGGVDEWRHLTARGRRAAAEAGHAIARLGPKPRRIITSPLTRAVQTAEIMARFACRKMTFEANRILLAGAEVAPVVEYLAACGEKERIMLVGHEPQLGALVRTLLQSDRVVELKKGGCVALKMGKKGRPGDFLWYLVPGSKPVTSEKKAFRKVQN